MQAWERLIGRRITAERKQLKAIRRESARTGRQVRELSERVRSLVE